MENPYESDITASAQQTLLHCRRIQSRSRVQKIFSHQTALRLLRIELPNPLNGRTLEICVKRKTNISRMKDVCYHQWSCRFSPFQVDDIIECVHPLDAWMQCAASLERDELVVLAESIIRCGFGIESYQFDPQYLLSNSSFFRYKRRCDAAFPLIRSGADSSQETRLRLKLIEAGLPEPNINYSPPGLTWDGDFPMRFDMAYVEQRILIEYDGRHHVYEYQRHRDNEKRSRAQVEGWRVLVIDSKNFDEASTLIRKTLASQLTIKSKYPIENRVTTFSCLADPTVAWPASLLRLVSGLWVCNG